jgi:hypothetical protein
MAAPNPYRGTIALPLPLGEVVAVVDTNALRMFMEDLGEHDLGKTLEGIQTNPVDRIPRLLFHGVKQAHYLTGQPEELPTWDRFVQLVEDVGLALDLGQDDGEADDDGKKKAGKAAR